MKDVKSAKRVVVQKFADCWVMIVFLSGEEAVSYVIPLNDLLIMGEQELFPGNMVHYFPEK